VALYCLDASVVLAWLLNENFVGVQSFFAAINDEDTFIAPQLLRPECTSVIREEAYAKRISQSEATELVSVLTQMEIRINHSLSQFSRALELSERFQNAKAYDAQYLAVAEMERAELVTVDRGLRHAANEVGVLVRWLT
jgi:predicted nucleic acid-binding protein